MRGARRSNTRRRSGRPDRPTGKIAGLLHDHDILGVGCRHRARSRQDRRLLYALRENLYLLLQRLDLFLAFLQLALTLLHLALALLELLLHLPQQARHFIGGVYG